MKLLRPWPLLALAVACAERAPPAPLAAVVEGCTAFAPDGACEHVPGTALRVFVDAEGPAEVSVDGATLAVTASVADTGRRFEVPLPDDAQALRLAVAGAAFGLSLRPVATATPTDPGRRAARADLDRARRRLRAGQAEAARGLLDQAADEARRAGDLALARDAELLAVQVEVSKLGEVAAARRRLAELPPVPEVDGRARVLTAFHRGLLASRMLDARAAQEALAAAERWAVRLDSPLLAYVAHERARMLMDLGRAPESARIFDALLPRAQGCLWAALATSAGWARLVARPRFELPRARALLQEALAAYTGPCALVIDANNVRVNLAFLAVDDDPADARRILEQVAGPEQPEARAWRHALLGRISMADPPQAKLHFEKLAEEARQLGHEVLAWQAELGLGQVAERQGDLREAVRRYRAAEAVLDRQSLLVPVNGGQRFLLEDKDESQRRLVGALLAEGEVAAAFQAARDARRRSVWALAVKDTLAGLGPADRDGFAEALARFEAARAQARARAADAWQVPEAERAAWRRQQAEADRTAAKALDEALLILARRGAARSRDAVEPGPGPDELWILPYPLLEPAQVFLARRGRVEVSTAPLDAEGWGALLAARLDAVTEVKVLSDPGPAAQGPELALVDGAPLVSRLPVAYTLDLPAPPSTSASAAVVVFDPKGDLKDARAEGRWVVKSLAEQAQQVRALGPREATTPRVLAALEGAGLFHYAGHGRFDPDGEWGSALLLSDGDLELGDLLALRAPHTVILSGCDAASTRPGKASVGLGLAQAFLAAGSAVAVATRAPVPSAEARAFAEHLHRALAREGDLGRAFAAARAAQPDGWRFVLLTRSG